MASQGDRLRAAQIRRLEACLAKPENRECFDCAALRPRWASTNLGIFICMRCAGIHRSLGTHLSKVKSINMDNWEEEMMRNCETIGNGEGKFLYEANLPAHFTKPKMNADNAEVERIIRHKFESKAYYPRPDQLAAHQGGHAVVATAAAVATAAVVGHTTPVAQAIARAVHQPTPASVVVHAVPMTAAPTTAGPDLFTAFAQSRAPVAAATAATAPSDSMFGQQPKPAATTASAAPVPAPNGLDFFTTPAAATQTAHTGPSVPSPAGFDMFSSPVASSASASQPISVQGHAVPLHQYRGPATTGDAADIFGAPVSNQQHHQQYHLSQPQPPQQPQHHYSSHAAPAPRDPFATHAAQSNFTSMYNVHNAPAHNAAPPAPAPADPFSTLARDRPKTPPHNAAHPPRPTEHAQHVPTQHHVTTATAAPNKRDLLDDLFA